MAHEEIPRRRLMLGGVLAGAGILLAACSDGSPSARQTPSPDPTPESPSPTPQPSDVEDSEAITKEGIREKYESAAPRQWGLEVDGVMTHVESGSGRAALTLDACGGPHGSGVDRELLNQLQRRGISATLFVNQRWCSENQSTMEQLVDEKFFELANHGTSHRPLSVDGRSAYGVAGTASVVEVFDEIMENQEYLADTYEVQCQYMRSGTAHWDEIAVSICADLGLTALGFTTNLDDGATAAAEDVTPAMYDLTPGGIRPGHFNQPAAGTGQGI
ncbi:MAG TPA: polysaccharide deacetylase family protein [Candidatus Nesterenkonia stercoripullorum]|uniref:Polysaccharide deacetylase family protein n=1 Tax=Candidatus Nesterenkonia stercoripullorum TaxID=2838701 RepID=A0A9D2A6U3_9MICC|nr:polysaccharide deacetylase family protein [Candidatus Nesterenkonia stercoripullorum]